MQLLTICVSSGAQSNKHGPIPLRKIALPADVRSDILATMTQALKGNCGDCESEAVARRIAANSVVTFVKLSPTGPQALLVEPNYSDGEAFGPYGGASWCLFRRAGNRTVVFLSGDWGFGGTLKTLHHGMWDVLIVKEFIHASAPSTAYEVDEFNGKGYVPAYCYESEDDTDEKGKTTSIDGPHHPC
jgi:hypothetical protein